MQMTWLSPCPSFHPILSISLVATFFLGSEFLLSVAARVHALKSINSRPNTIVSSVRGAASGSHGTPTNLS